MQETWVQFLSWEDLLKKEMATHSSILAWKIQWTEEPDGLQPMGLERVSHDWMTSTSILAWEIPWTEEPDRVTVHRAAQSQVWLRQPNNNNNNNNSVNSIVFVWADTWQHTSYLVRNENSRVQAPWSLFTALGVGVYLVGNWRQGEFQVEESHDRFTFREDCCGCYEHFRVWESFRNNGYNLEEMVEWWRCCMSETRQKGWLSSWCESWRHWGSLPKGTGDEEQPGEASSVFWRRWVAGQLSGAISQSMLSHFSCVWFLVTLWTVACQAPLPMGFSG